MIAQRAHHSRTAKIAAQLRNSGALSQLTVAPWHRLRTIPCEFAIKLAPLAERLGDSQYLDNVRAS